MERWLEIPGWPAYEVSSHGLVRSLNRRIKSQLGNSGTRFCVGRMLTQREVRRHKNDKTVYLNVSLYSGQRKRNVGVHVLVLMAFFGRRPRGMRCRHLNGDGLDNRPANLRWGTPKENEADKRRHGRMLIGEKHHQAKLTAQDVIAIRKSALTSPHVAKLFGVHEGSVRMIRRYRTWRHLKKIKQPKRVQPIPYSLLKAIGWKSRKSRVTAP